MYGTARQDTKDTNTTRPINEFLSFCHDWCGMVVVVGGHPPPRPGAAIGKDCSFLGLPILLKPGTKTASAHGTAPYATTGVGTFGIDYNQVSR